MNSIIRLRSLVLPVSAFVFLAATAFAQGGRGGGGGTAGLARPMPEGGLPTEALQPNTLNDIEVTAITRVELNGPMADALKAARAARTAMIEASLTMSANSPDIAAKSRALGQAELQLALAQADVFAELMRSMGNMTPEKRQAVMSEISG